MDLENLINGCKNGDAKSQKEFYNQYHQIIYITCKQYIKCQFEAEDLSHDILLKIMDKLDSFTGNKKEQFLGWIIRISKNASIDFIRRKKSQIEYRDDESFGGIDCEMILNLFGEDNELDMGIIYSAIDKLSDAYRSVFDMYCLYDFTHNDISEELGISVGSSKSNLFKAKRKIMKYLNNNNKDKVVL